MRIFRRATTTRDSTARHCHSSRVKCTAQEAREVTASANHFTRQHDRDTTPRWRCRPKTTAASPLPQNGSECTFICKAGEKWAKWHFERACHWSECVQWFAKFFLANVTITTTPCALISHVPITLDRTWHADEPHNQCNGNLTNRKSQPSPSSDAGAALFLWAFPYSQK